MCANVCETELRNEFFSQTWRIDRVPTDTTQSTEKTAVVKHNRLCVSRLQYSHMCLALYVTIPVVILSNECALLLCMSMSMCYLLVRRKKTFVFSSTSFTHGLCLTDKN